MERSGSHVGEISRKVVVIEQNCKVMDNLWKLVESAENIVVIALQILGGIYFPLSDSLFVLQNSGTQPCAISVTLLPVPVSL